MYLLQRQLTGLPDNVSVPGEVSLGRMRLVEARIGATLSGYESQTSSSDEGFIFLKNNQDQACVVPDEVQTSGYLRYGVANAACDRE